MIINRDRDAGTIEGQEGHKFEEGTCTDYDVIMESEFEF